ncbi:MAG: PHP domain-containing protein [Candidatus Aminicenantaceae bacterium]
MQGLIDLHLHSNKSSDGDLTPLHIIKLAKEYGFRAISIADHDTVDAYPQAIQFGKKNGVEVIPNMELTTLFQDREFHLLLPFLNWKSKAVSRLIHRVYDKRVNEAKMRIKKLREMGFDIDWKKVNKYTKGIPPLGVTLAQILLDEAAKRDDASLQKYFKEENKHFAPYIFYKDYFTYKKPAYVQKQNIDLLDVLKNISKTGGVPVLAHPGAYFQNVSKQDIMLLKKAGLQGIEVFTSYHDSFQTQYYQNIADEFDLVPTAGSDFHGRIKPNIVFGVIKEGEYWMINELRKRKK